MINLGDVTVSTVIDFKWPSTAVDGSSITRGTNGTIRIYKDNSNTERSSANGITDTEDADSLTGVHHCRVDLSDNTDAGFYAVGSTYHAVLAGAVIDGKTVNYPLARWVIRTYGNLDAIVTSFLGHATYGLPAIKTGLGGVNVSGMDIAVQNAIKDHVTVVGMDSAVIAAIQASCNVSAMDASVRTAIQAAVNVASLDAAAITSIFAKAMTELTSVPSGTAATVMQMLTFLYMAARNQRVTTATSDKVHNNAGTAIMSSTLSEAAGTFTKTAYANFP